MGSPEQPLGNNSLREFDGKKVPLTASISFEDYRTKYNQLAQNAREYWSKQSAKYEKVIEPIVAPSLEELLKMINYLDVVKESLQPVGLDSFRYFPWYESDKKNIEYRIERIEANGSLSRKRKNLKIADVGASALGFNDNFGITLIGTSENIFPKVDAVLRTRPEFKDLFVFGDNLINQEWDRGTPHQKGSVNRDTNFANWKSMTAEQQEEVEYGHSTFFIRQYEGDPSNTVQIALHGTSAGVAGTTRLITQFALEKGYGVHVDDQRIKASNQWAGVLYFPELRQE